MLPAAVHLEGANYLAARLRLWNGQQKLGALTLPTVARMRVVVRQIITPEIGVAA